MKTKALNSVKNYAMDFGGRHIIAALSGGSDSMALVHFLNSIKDSLGFSLTAAHVNHGIRGDEAIRDEKFVVDYCNKNNIPVKVLRVSIPEIIKQTKESSEEAGRRVRYEFFRSIDENALIATAHNADDCIETFFLNLTRGTGLRGLTGIPPVRDNIIRPLIDCTKAEIIDYCNQNRIAYVTDSTNLTDDYNRNKIRNNIIPVLKEINPSFTDCFLRCTASLKTDESFLRSETQKYLDSCFIPNGGYSIDAIMSAPENLRGRIVFSAVEQLCGTVPESKHINKIMRFMQSGGSENINGGKTVVSDGARLYLKESEKRTEYEPIVLNTLKKSVHFADKVIDLSLENERKIKKINKSVFNYLIDYDKIIYPITIRSKIDGDKFRPYGRKVTKSLKKLFCEYKYDFAQKNRAVIIADKNGIICADGLGFDERFAVTEKTERILKITIRREINE